MKNKNIVSFFIVVFISSIIILLFAIKDNSQGQINIVEVNDIAQSLANNWESLNENNLPGKNYNLDYAIFDNNNRFLLRTNDDVNTDINSSIINRDTIIDISRDEETLGKLVIYNNSFLYWHQYKTNLSILLISFMFLITIITILYANYVDRRVIRPFHKLQRFAKHVALGNLDIPLQMDKGNMFGAFTESFDLMRDELNKARAAERIANQSKKELVASLSHDIKTPVASIKAVTEIMLAKTNDEYEKRQLHNINIKADQINTLITNMFNATLEEMQELKVNVTEQSSRIIYEIIKNADYNNQVVISSTSEGIIIVDPLRLSQVIDNIISNSYKYANTSINVSIFIDNNYLIIDFKDFGKGVPNDELPLIFNKFYRAKNAEGKNGTGLGLYIAKYLLNKMSGDIECRNDNDGFIVTVKLLLAGFKN